MQKTPKFFRPRAFVAVPLVAFALALGVSLAVRARADLYSWMFGPSGLWGETTHGPGTAKAFESPKRGKTLGLALRSQDNLLTDSILSIVQSYYVDQERVDNRSLLATAVSALNASPRVSSGESPTGLWIEIDGQRKSFALPPEPRYQDVLEAFREIAALLDDQQISVAIGESTEKDAPGSIVLLNSMLAQLDAHSALLSPDAYKELRQGTEGSFGGLGVLVGIRDSMLTVIKPLPRSPAQRAGIKKKDRILGIDGVDTYGYSLDELVEYMRGEPGTSVHLSLLRDGSVSPAEMILKREIIQVDSVVARELTQGDMKVLHLTVENFASRTSREVLAAIKKARGRSGNLSGLVLDLRTNPGGLLDQAVQVADLFLQSGVIVTTKGRREETETAGSGFDEIGFPVVVLVNGDSASASEIVAGALQDHGRAVVIGQPSFGKGSVQTIFELPGERALKLTIARYYTPGGHSIQNVGIIPDVWLQPVYRKEQNDNLFGSYRYKNERFLRNHLDSGAHASRHESSLRWPSLKGYYLVDREEDDEERLKDRELDLAVALIAKVHKTYGNDLPDEASRASHWLGLAGPELSKMTAAIDGESSQWLQQKYRVSWKTPAKSGFDAKLSLNILTKKLPHVQPGQTVDISYAIENHEDHPIDRMSIFVRSETSGFETHEELLGSLKAHGKLPGKLRVQIPSHWEPGPLLLRIGAAIDAWPARDAAADVVVDVVPRKAAELLAEAELTQEVGGSIAGVLEGLEKAKLRVKLQNIGDAHARELRIRLVNLSGSQVLIDEKARNIAKLDIGGGGELEFTIEAGKTLHSGELAFGIMAESADLKLPMRRRFVIKARANSELSSAKATTSH